MKVADLKKQWLTAIRFISTTLLLLSSSFSLANDQLQLLKICLPENSPPYTNTESGNPDKNTSGFDVAFSEALANKLHRQAEIVWFESEDDDESAYDLEVSALLAAGVCDIAAGFPLYQPLLQEPTISMVKLPEMTGRRNKTRESVSIGRLIASLPYHFAPLTVLLSPSTENIKIKSIADLPYKKLGSEEGTLADVLLMSTAHGSLVPRIHHFVPGNKIFQALEEDSLDAILIEQHRFDAYLQRHPDSHINETGYTHSIGFNMGLVLSETQARLLEEINPAISEMLNSGEIQTIANNSAMRYFEPRSPAIRPGLTPMDLLND